jgi:hypothetical protein
MNYARNVTMIDDLPELSDVESGRGGFPMGRGPPPGRRPSAHPQGYQLAHNPHIGGNLPPAIADKYKRMVRQTRHQPMQESGMALYNEPPPQAHPHMVEAYNGGPPEQIEQPSAEPPANPALTGISCLDIANHVKDCPICSKFYNNDKTVYIIVIVVLAVICLLLLKKVLDV